MNKFYQKFFVAIPYEMISDFDMFGFRMLYGIVCNADGGSIINMNRSRSI